MKYKVIRYSRIEMLHVLESETGERIEVNMPKSGVCVEYEKLRNKPNVTAKELMEFMKNVVGKYVNINENSNKN